MSIDLRPWCIQLPGSARQDFYEPAKYLGIGTPVYTADQVSELLRLERERCAKVCDDLYHQKEVFLSSAAWDEGEATGYETAANAIRALPNEVKP